MVERHSFTMALSTNKHLWAPIWKPVGYIFCKVILGVLNFSSNFWILSLVLSLGFSRVFSRISQIFLLGIISYRTSCIYNEPNHYKNWNDFLLTEKGVIKHLETRENCDYRLHVVGKCTWKTWEDSSWKILFQVGDYTLKLDSCSHFSNFIRNFPTSSFFTQPFPTSRFSQTQIFHFSN